MKTLLASILLIASFHSTALTLECEGRGLLKAPRSAIFESYEDSQTLGKSEEFILRVYKLKSCFFPRRDYRTCSSVELNKVVTLSQNPAATEEYQSSDFEIGRAHV